MLARLVIPLAPMLARLSEQAEGQSQLCSCSNMFLFLRGSTLHWNGVSLRLEPTLEVHLEPTLEPILHLEVHTELALSLGLKTIGRHCLRLQLEVGDKRFVLTGTRPYDSMNSTTGTSYAYMRT